MKYDLKIEIQRPRSEESVSGTAEATKRVLTSYRTRGGVLRSTFRADYVDKEASMPDRRV